MQLLLSHSLIFKYHEMLAKVHTFFTMKIPSKWELQQIKFNDSSDIDFEDFMNLCKKCTVKLYSLLVIDKTLASDNPLCFRHLLECL